MEASSTRESSLRLDAVETALGSEIWDVVHPWVERQQRERPWDGALEMSAEIGGRLWLKRQLIGHAEGLDRIRETAGLCLLTGVITTHGFRIVRHADNHSYLRTHLMTVLGRMKVRVKSFDSEVLDHAASWFERAGDISIESGEIAPYRYVNAADSIYRIAATYIALGESSLSATRPSTVGAA